MNNRDVLLKMALDYRKGYGLGDLFQAGDDNEVKEAFQEFAEQTGHSQGDRNCWTNMKTI